MSDIKPDQPTDNQPQEQAQTTPPTMGRGATSLQSLLNQEAEARAATEEAKKHKAAVEDAYRLRELAKNNPSAFLQQVGVDPTSINPEAMRPDPVEDVLSKHSALEAQVRQMQEEKRQAERQAAIESARSDVVSFINDSEEYPFTKTLGLQDAVFDRLLEAHQSGRALSEAEATREVEEALVENVVPGLLQLVLEDDKLREKFAPGYVKQGQQIRPKQTPLTNDMSTEVAVKQKPSFGSASEFEDSIASMLRFTQE